MARRPRATAPTLRRFFDDPAMRPDELKIYPCSLIAGTELYDRWQAGEYHPYTLDELVALLADVKPTIPPWTRVNRLFRDIPAHHIEAGVTGGQPARGGAGRTARGAGSAAAAFAAARSSSSGVDPHAVSLRVTDSYDTDLTREHFLEFVTTGADAARPHRRLPAPEPAAGQRTPAAAPSCPKLRAMRMIREVHVYGPALGVDDDRPRRSDPARGAGHAAARCGAGNRTRRGLYAISVIAATGTQAYYATRGFAAGDLYMTAPLTV